jgi:hypothetical protein
VSNNQEVTAMYQHSGSRDSSSARSGYTLASIRATAAQRRREHIWAWASLLLLLLCWDAALRLDQKVAMPRPRLGHWVELEAEEGVRVEAGR